MKKDSNKLTFNKEKVANLSSADLENVVGGQADIGESTKTGFTCHMCTTLTAPTTEEQA